MDNETKLAIIAAIIGAIVGAIIQSLLIPNLITIFFSRIKKKESLAGVWDSYWGPTEKESHKFHEVINIKKQKGNRIWGRATRQEEPDKVWDIEGRYDRDYIQMHYFPSKEAKDKDFLDYGSYFLKRNAIGVFCGFSAGFGPDEVNGHDNLSTSYHEMSRRK